MIENKNPQDAEANLGIAVILYYFLNQSIVDKLIRYFTPIVIPKMEPITTAADKLIAAAHSNTTHGLILSPFFVFL
jgi:hypothetical protein